MNSEPRPLAGKENICLIGPVILKRKAVRLTLKYYFRLEQRPGDATGDSQQFPLPCEHPHNGGLAEFWQVDGAAVSHPDRTFWRRNHSGKFGQHQP